MKAVDELVIRAKRCAATCREPLGNRDWMADLAQRDRLLLEIEDWLRLCEAPRSIEDKERAVGLLPKLKEARAALWDTEAGREMAARVEALGKSHGLKGRALLAVEAVLRKKAGETNLAIGRRFKEEGRIWVGVKSDKDLMSNVSKLIKEQGEELERCGLSE